MAGKTKQEMLIALVRIREELIAANKKLESMLSDFMREFPEADIEKAYKHEEPRAK